MPAPFTLGYSEEALKEKQPRLRTAATANFRLA
jgi:hypothetical protein